MSIIEELQALDEGMKRKILIVTTVIIMVIILFFWIAYFNNIVTGGSQAPVVAQQAGTGQTVQQEIQQPAPGAAPGESLWQRIANGFTGFFHNFGSIFNGTRQYNIQPQNS